MLSTILNFALAAIMWLAGCFVFVISVLQILLTFTVTLPLSKKSYLEYRENFNYTCAKIDAISTIIIDMLVFAVPTALVMIFGNEYAKFGYFIGMAITFVFSIGKLSPKNPDNFKDFYTKTFIKNYRGSINDLNDYS